MSAISSSKSIRLLIVFGGVALVGYLVFLAVPSSAPQVVFRRTLESADPLSGGQEVSLAAANALIKKYGTAELELTGPAGIDHVTNAWIDGQGQVALELDSGSGILFIYSPDTRTSDQWAEGAAEEIQRGSWEGTMMPLRGVMARAGEKSEEWSSTIAWLEGKALVEMYGDGGQQLEELIPIAQNMRYAGS